MGMPVMGLLQRTSSLPGGSPQKAYRDLPEFQIRRHYVVFMLVLVTPLLFVAFCFSSFLSKLHVGNSASRILPEMDFSAFPDCCKYCGPELDFLTKTAAKRPFEDHLGQSGAVEQSMGKAGAQTGRGMSSVGETESAGQSEGRAKGPLRVFVYDLPRNFTSDFYQHADATVSKDQIFLPLPNVCGHANIVFVIGRSEF